ncbi:hypothetical protein DPEC_G00294420 [Dallia pectoralis]|uniref:Uncharacterized protein n=1 Tax=Dallia pectoralis TaxID=75939 RepID=A0ACC2FIH9_DALPE|nr:hypothetical protein DPEC_G00294420 [Dallia pectoralis]
MVQLLGRKYWWSSLAEDIRDYVLSCPICAQSKTPRQLPEGKLMPLRTPARPWSHIAMDFVTDLPVSEGYTVILVVVDRFSKMCRLIPLHKLPNATQMAEVVFLQVFRQFGLPEDIVSDRGPQFISRVWKAFCDRLGVSISLSSGYHPQSNGQTERLNQEIGRYLRQQCARQPQEWSRYLPWVEYAQNSLMHSSLRLTPFQCVFGYQPPLFPWDTEPGMVPSVDEWYRQSAKVWETAHRHLQQASHHQKEFADRRRRPTPTYHPGQRVWLSTRDLRLRQSCRKLTPRYIGPFKIIRRINPVTYRLQLPRYYRIASSFHVSLLKPVHYSPMHPAVDLQPVPPPLEAEGDPVYRVKDLLDSRRRGGGIQYLVDWEGFGPEERSWIPARDVLDPALKTAFHSARPERPAPRPRGRPPGRHSRASGAARGEGDTVRTRSLRSSMGQGTRPPQANRGDQARSNSPVF